MIRDLSKKDLEKANGGLSTLLGLDFPRSNTPEISDVTGSLTYNISVTLLNNDSTGPLPGNERISNIVQEEAYRERYVYSDRVVRPHTFRSKFLRRN